MKPEQLIDLLAVRAAPVSQRYFGRRYAAALAAGTACALVARCWQRLDRSGRDTI